MNENNKLKNRYNIMKTCLAIFYFMVVISLNLFSQVIGTTEAGFEDGKSPKLDKPIRMTPYIE